MFFTNRFYSFDFAYKRELYFLVTILLAAIMGLSLYSYNVHDPSWFHYFSDPQQTENLFGLFGANIASILIYLFGTASYLVPVLIVTGGYLMWDTSDWKEEWERFAAMFVLLISVSVLVTVHRIDLFHSSVAGGYVGYGVTVLLYRLFDHVGSTIFAYAGVYASLVLLVRFSFIGTARFLIRSTSQAYDFLVRHRVAHRAYAVILFVARSCNTVVRYGWKWVDGSAFDAPQAATNLSFPQEQFSSSSHEESCEQPVATYNESDEQQGGLADESGMYAAQESEAASYGLPNLDIFIGVDDQREDKQFKRDLEERARVLEEKLERFSVHGKVISIKSGPVVTLFEYQPNIDTKVSKILALEDDLAMTLQALSIRIIAPIPGRSVVGFEVSNKKRKDVLLASVIQSPEYLEFDGLLPLILGQDTVGKDVVVDLAKMPHLLIAGSTGSGKSVALNSMLISLLCKCTPDELRMILIDPKRLEFAPYADIPHLLFPIVTDPKKSVPILKWVVKQMEERYEKMSHHGVRNVFEYNKLAKAQGEEIFPFIVIVIDELSDLMMTVGRDVEDLITRITQMARAAGIHMIIATQRPSVDVITGLIKVNFPSRISCRVTSKVDSRTILDCGGADKLLGRGDMLFLDSTASVLKRVHGSYVSDHEISSVTSHIRNQRVVEYLDITEELAADEANLSSEDEELYKQVVSYLDSVDEISISSLQRAFRIGYNRSARIIAMLEMHGLIMPADGSRTRRVIR